MTGTDTLRVPELSNIVTVMLSVDPRTTTDVEGELPAVYALDQNYPNPFNPVTRIAYSLAQAGPVQITVFDVLGRKVATPVDGSAPAGRHEVDFDAANLPSGLYLYRITAGAFCAIGDGRQNLFLATLEARNNEALLLEGVGIIARRAELNGAG